MNIDDRVTATGVTTDSPRIDRMAVGDEFDWDSSRWKVLNANRHCLLARLLSAPHGGVLRCLDSGDSWRVGTSRYCWRAPAARG
jgi:hypothetical protein